MAKDGRLGFVRKDLAQLREKAGYTLVSFAKAIGAGQGSWCYIECGKRRCRISLAHNIAKLLGLSGVKDVYSRQAEKVNGVKDKPVK